jgi:NAD(P)-dependent dehydrogenase (short-subunit alcohol dehydrogenase family)
MDLQLLNKVAIVTGSSRGLGLASARALAKEGCRIVLCARDADTLARAAAGIEGAAARPGSVLAVPADVSTPEGAEAVVTAAVERTPVSGASPDESLAIEVSRELARNHRLSEATFNAARKRLGDRGVTDLIAAVGYYAMLAVCHVALDVTH